MKSIAQTASQQSVRIIDGPAALDGDLRVPARADGLVIFAHGSGSSRFSPRNRQVASVLESAGFATLMLDLLTREEETADLKTGWFRFDIERLGRRVVAAADWAASHEPLSALRQGYFGASTGAAAALIAAAERPRLCAAVVSRGGRPDLADEALERVQAPTLLIVGGDDTLVIELNEQASQRMHAEVALGIVPHATHLFEEQGALDEVSMLATDWFRRYLSGSASSQRGGSNE